jgi:hypothetical protein
VRRPAGGDGEFLTTLCSLGAVRLPLLWRAVIVALGAASLVLVACAATAGAGAPAGVHVVHSTRDGHSARAPQPGPCLANAAQCGGAGSLVASSATFGTTPLVVGGPALVGAALALRVRRSPRRSAALPDGMPLLVMRPPRALPVFA